MWVLSVFPFEFANPYGLFFLLILIPVVYLWLRSLSPLPPWREKLSLLSRFVMVLALVFALSEMRWIWKVEQLAVIFVLDISESINTYSQDQAIQWINQACKGMTEKDKAALIVFGTNAYIDLPLQPRMKISEITSIPERNFTDISRAIRLALASFPEHTQKKIMVLTDGNENLGNALSEALIAKSNNVRIFCKKINQAPEVEVLLEQIILPSEVRLKQAFDLKLIIKSFQQTKTKVRIYRNERYLGEDVMTLDPGTNILKIPQKIEEPGFVNYEVHLEPQNDTIRYNNQMTGFTLVQGESKVLYLEGKEGKSEYLHSVLKEAGLLVDVRSRFEIPTTLPELNNYDCVILSDIPSSAFSPEQMIFFKRYVEDMGGGLIMIGGDDSFGVGLYAGTPIEEVLPVNMEVRQKKHLASMAMVIVIDQSGSMSMTVPDGRTKLQLACEAACGTIDLLKSYDMVEVLMTDTAPKSLFPLQKVGGTANREVLKEHIRSNRGGGGGIYCYSGLVPAYKNLSGTDTMIKHIILFADGSDSEQKEGCEPLAARYFNENITLTTVSLGVGHDTPWLQNLSLTGGGQFYVAEDAMDLPRIFAKDTLLASKNVVVDKEFRPVMTGTAEFLKGIQWDQTPSLYGYVATTKKDSPLVEELLQAIDQDPLLVRWHCGLGKSVAFTSDCKDRWSKDWIRWEGYKKLWPQLVRWSVRSKHNKNIRVHQKFEKGNGLCVVEVLDDEGNYENFLNLEARIIKPDGSSEILTLGQTAPGQYTTKFHAMTEGTYMTTLLEKRDGASNIISTVAASQSYPIEYKELEPKDIILTQMSEITNGAVIEEPTTLFKHDVEEVKAHRDIFLPLLILALIALLIDIIARRFVLPAEMFKIRRRIQTADSQASMMMGRLKARKADLYEKLKTSTAQKGVLPESLPKTKDLSIQTTRMPQNIPQPPPSAPPVIEEDNYTARLLKAKKRAQGPDGDLKK